MATQTQKLLVDDFDGTEATGTVQFALDGVQYEIDLNDVNATELRATLNPYIEVGRRTGGRAKRSKNGTKAARIGVDPATVRAWAAQNGIEVSPRGRIAGSVVKAFVAAEGD